MEIHMPVTRIAEPHTGVMSSGTEDQQVIRLQFIRNPLLDHLPGARPECTENPARTSCG